MILIFDLMDTIIEDPFFKNFFFRLSEEKKKNWIRIKNYDAYRLFEEGKILEKEYFRISYQIDPIAFQLPLPQKIKKIMFKEVHYLPGIPELFSKIQLCKKEYSICTVLASNYSIWYHEIFKKKKELPDWFDYIFFSCEMGVRKPDLEFFRMIENTIISKNKSEEVIFFDDRKENLKVASLLGWKTVWISEKTQSSFIIYKELKKKCPHL